VQEKIGCAAEAERQSGEAELAILPEEAQPSSIILVDSHLVERRLEVGDERVLVQAKANQYVGDQKQEIRSGVE
jgi:hypothetical protein